MDRSVKAQMKYADKVGARYVAVIGDNEVETGNAEAKDMRTGDTISLSLDALLLEGAGEYLKVRVFLGA